MEPRSDNTIGRPKKEKTDKKGGKTTSTNL